MIRFMPDIIGSKVGKLDSLVVEFGPVTQINPQRYVTRQPISSFWRDQARRSRIVLERDVTIPRRVTPRRALELRTSDSQTFLGVSRSDLRG